jgi:hypothetical protein
MLKRGDYFEDTYIGGRIILKWIFKNWISRVWTGFNWFRIMNTVTNDPVP